MKRMALFLLIAAVAISSADAQEITRTKQKEDGFKWYLLEQGDYQGIENTKGETIIPLEKEFKKINFFLGFFRARDRNYKYELYDTEGNIIIPIERGYDDIWPQMEYVGRNSRKQKVNWFVVEKKLEGKKGYGYGVCDKNTNEIIAPTLPNRVYFDNYNAHTFYIKSDNVKQYIGITLDAQENIIPDPDHPFGSTEDGNYQQEATVYNNSYNNSYNNTYNNTYTPPTQHKQQSTGNTNNTSSATKPKNPASSSASTQSSNKSSSSTNKPTSNKNNAPSYPSTTVKCQHCRGTGLASCWSCNGKGTVRKSGIDKYGKQVFRDERCTGCGGSGRRKCTVCNGKGTR